MSSTTSFGKGQCPHLHLPGSIREQKHNPKRKSCVSRPAAHSPPSETKLSKKKLSLIRGLAVYEKAPPTAKPKEKAWTCLRPAQHMKSMAFPAAPRRSPLPADPRNTALPARPLCPPAPASFSTQARGSASEGSALPGISSVVQRDSGTAMDTRTWAPLAADQGLFVDKHMLQGTFHSMPLAASCSTSRPLLRLLYDLFC